jgi:hypothetical protein
MDDLTRRRAFGAAAIGTLGLSTTFAAQPDEPAKPALKPEDTASAPKRASKTADESKDRKAVMGAGMTADEAECWELVAKAAGKFFSLPKEHPMDDHEVAHAIHVIQNKLLGRPTYRKYLELAKALHGGS